jgi:hypothetical protein
MTNLREELHRLVDELPNATLEHAKTALVYCANPEKQRMTVERVKERVRRNSERHLQRHVERTGRGLAFAGGGGGHTFVDGSHHSSMPAFIDGKEATYHLYLHRGVIFEVIETIEIAEDSQRLIRRERIRGTDGNEQNLTAELPVLPYDSSGNLLADF